MEEDAPGTRRVLEDQGRVADAGIDVGDGAIGVIAERRGSPEGENLCGGRKDGNRR